MIRTIIIEDESAAQSLLSKILAKYCADIEILGFADSVEEGFEFINKENPDLVFLDIVLKDSTSFDILDKFENPNFKIIFTTGYDDHALKAFKYEAIHYLLKPYQIIDVVEAVQRVKKLMKNDSTIIKTQSADQATQNGSVINNKISFSTKDGITLVNIDDIIRLEADRSYCYVYINNQKRIMVSKTLKTFADTLPSSIFFRSHSSHLINLNYVTKFLKEDGGEIIMSDGSSVPIARRRKSIFLDML